MKRPQTAWWLRHGDKIFIAAVLVVCTVALVSFWRGAPPPSADPPTGGGHTRGGFVWPTFETRLPDVSVDLATDADEYLPGPGEHICVNH